MKNVFDLAISVILAVGFFAAAYILMQNVPILSSLAVSKSNVVDATLRAFIYEASIWVGYGATILLVLAGYWFAESALEDLTG